jgi:hypothetical protein
MSRPTDNAEAVKAKLVGSTTLLKATGDHIPAPARLQAPLEGPGSVVPSFCTGCGQYYELTDAGARQLAESDGLGRFPDSLEGQFFQVASCSQCDGQSPAVQLRRISEL